MAPQVPVFISDESEAIRSGYFSLSVDSSSDLSHSNQLSTELRYIKDGKTIEQFLALLYWWNDGQ